MSDFCQCLSLIMYHFIYFLCVSAQVDGRAAHIKIYLYFKEAIFACVVWHIVLSSLCKNDLFSLYQHRNYIIYVRRGRNMCIKWKCHQRLMNYDYINQCFVHKMSPSFWLPRERSKKCQKIWGIKNWIRYMWGLTFHSLCFFFFHLLNYF